MPAIPDQRVEHFSPIDTLVLRPNARPSLLDTIFVSRRSRRAVYATTTRGPETCLWRVASNGVLTQVAQVNWDHQVMMHGGSVTAGDGSLRKNNSMGKCEVVVFNGKTMKTDEFLRKSKGWFPSDSRLLTIKDKEFKWKSGGEHSGENTNAPFHEVWKIWRCIAINKSTSLHTRGQSSNSASISTGAISGENALHVEEPSQANRLYPSTSTAPTNFVSSESLHLHSPNENTASISTASSVLTAPAPPTVLARFTPPQAGLLKNEIALFPPVFESSNPVDNVYTLEHLLVSMVLLAVSKGEWRQVQSANGPEALQRILVAEAAGEVPPYTPTFGRTLERGPVEVRRQRIRSGTEGSRARTAPEATHSTDYCDYSENTPLLSQRNTHRTTRSIPTNWFTPSFNGERGRTRTADSGSATSQRGRVSGSNGPSDGIFARPRLSGQQGRPVSARRAPLSERQMNGWGESDVGNGLLRRPATSPAPEYARWGWDPK